MRGNTICYSIQIINYISIEFSKLEVCEVAKRILFTGKKSIFFQNQQKISLNSLNRVVMDWKVVIHFALWHKDFLSVWVSWHSGWLWQLLYHICGWLIFRSLKAGWHCSAYEILVFSGSTEEDSNSYLVANLVNSHKATLTIIQFPWSALCA